MPVAYSQVSLLGTSNIIIFFFIWTVFSFSSDVHWSQDTLTRRGKIPRELQATPESTQVDGVQSGDDVCQTIEPATSLGNLSMDSLGTAEDILSGDNASPDRVEPDVEEECAQSVAMQSIVQVVRDCPKFINYFFFFNQ